MSGCQRVEHEANVMVGGDRSILTRMAISVRSMAIWPLSSSKRRRNRNGAFCLKNSKMADNAMLAMLLCTLLRRASGKAAYARRTRSISAERRFIRCPNLNTRAAETQSREPVLGIA